MFLSSEQQLRKLTEGLDALQQSALDMLRDELKHTDKAMDRLHLKDMAHMVEMDISCRASMCRVEELLPKINIPEASYSLFMVDSALILSELALCDIPPAVRPSYDAAYAVVQKTGKLSPGHIFTIISVIVTAVSLCLTKLPLEKQPQVVQELDKLLEIKFNQLNLMQQMARWHDDFLN
ncbi:MAG TPA: hypothetical protein DEB31_06910 [Clostridiales bacterium]|nr:hypothetical protein [Clostridiales bacterium]